MAASSRNLLFRKKFRREWRENKIKVNTISCNISGCEMVGTVNKYSKKLGTGKMIGGCCVSSRSPTQRSSSWWWLWTHARCIYRVLLSALLLHRSYAVFINYSWAALPKHRLRHAGTVFFAFLQSFLDSRWPATYRYLLLVMFVPKLAKVFFYL